MVNSQTVIFSQIFGGLHKLLKRSMHYTSNTRRPIEFQEIIYFPLVTVFGYNC